MNEQKKTVRLAKMGMLAAISIILVAIVHIPFPLLPFLEYDPADVSIMIGAFAFGPVGGLMITVIVSVIQGTLFASTGYYGVIMHIISTGTFVLIAGNLYRKKKTRKMAVIALSAGCICATLVMMPANYFITALYFQMPSAAIVPMLPGIALFNILKFGLNSLLTFILYKKLSGFLHK